MALEAHQKVNLDPDSVVTTALLRATEILGMSQKDIARTLGISAASVSRLGRGRLISSESKEGELALVMLRIFRSLDTLVGGNETAMRAWFQSANQHVGGVPAELVEHVSGLVHVAEYLDAMRGTL